MDSRTSRIIVWNPITNNARYIADPGSLNYTDNHCVSGLAIYSVVPIQETHNFLIIFLHRRSNVDEPYKMKIYESTIDAWYHASEPPNPNNFILQQSVVIGRPVYWINLAGEFPHNPLSLLSYSTVDGSWLDGTVDVLVKTSSVFSIKILSKITLKMINKNNRELMESGRLEFDRNVVISEMFHYQPSLE
ncbi:hypothetical protein PIB30_080783 [Stylosanthes scabra]|uniref:F-box associated beta-propeller type 1 domain-containing protein n=1 Tax=Stylosanthes scabra TaxID=79078 RepID=A0ABU6WRA3_9FABA|nr:hypothetical protein [Stylosanthes scabra]